MNLKSPGDFADDVRRFECSLVEIKNRFAFRADEVMMWFGHGINAKRTVMQAELAQDTAFDKGVQGLVNRGQRDAGYLLANHGINLFGAGVAGRRHQGLIDDGTLMGQGQTVPPAQFAKVGARRLLHLQDLMLVVL
jgi:hypothetical protein